MATGPPQHPEEAQADPVSSSTQRAFHSPAVDHVEQQPNNGVLEHAIHKVGVNALPMKNSKAELVPCHIAGLSLEDQLQYKSNKGLPETMEEVVRKIVRSEHAAVLNEQTATRSTVQTLMDKVDRHEREHEKHNREVRDLKKAVNDLKKQIDGKDQEIRGLKEQVSNLESQAAENEAKLRSMKEKLEQTKQERKALELRLNEYQTRCEAAEGKCAAAEKKCAAAEKKYAAAEASKRELRRTNAQQLVDLLGQVLPRQNLQRQTLPADQPPPSSADCVSQSDPQSVQPTNDSDFVLRVQRPSSHGQNPPPNPMGAPERTQDGRGRRPGHGDDVLVRLGNDDGD